MLKKKYLILVLFLSIIVIGCSKNQINNDKYYYSESNQEIFYSEYGDDSNPQILLIHGLMGSSSSYNYIIEFLSKDYKITVIDLPGHGKSNLEIKFDVTNLSKVIEEFIEKKFSTPIILVGYSLGGTIINEIVTNSNELTSSIIFLDPWFSNNSSLDSLAFKFLSVVEKNAKNSWVAPEDSFKHIEKMSPRLTKEQIELIANNRLNYDLKIWDNSIQKETLIKDSEYPIETPSLILKPSSSLVKESQIKKLSEKYSSLVVKEIENTTHMFIFEKPEKISNLIDEFIK